MCVSSGQKELEYQQNNFSLQFCLAYNLPIWLYITSADISQKVGQNCTFKLFCWYSRVQGGSHFYTVQGLFSINKGKNISIYFQSL